MTVTLAVQLYLYHRDRNGDQSGDFSLGYWRTTIGTQIVQCFAVVTTSLPYARSMMDNLDSGLLGVKLGETMKGSGYGSGRAYELLDVSRGTKATQPDSSVIRTTKTVTIETHSVK